MDISINIEFGSLIDALTATAQMAASFVPIKLPLAWRNHADNQIQPMKAFEALKKLPATSAMLASLATASPHLAGHSKLIQSLHEPSSSMFLPSQIIQGERGATSDGLFDDVLAALLRFRHCDSSLPESQFVAGLWYPIIDILKASSFWDALKGGDFPGNFTTTEYKTEAFEKNVGSSQRIDIAMVLDDLEKYDPGWNSKLPIFCAEAASERIPYGTITAGAYPKDYSKCAVIALMILLRLVGQFRDQPRILERLRVHGAFLCGTQIQFYVLVPVSSDNSWELKTISYVYQTLQDYRLDLGTPNFPCMYPAKYCSDVFTADRDVGKMELSAENDGLADTESDASDQMDVESTTSEAPVTNNQKDCHGNNDLEGLSTAIIRLISMFELVAADFKFIQSAYGKKKKLHEPYHLHNKLLETLPSSSSKHSGSSPVKPNDTPGGVGKHTRSHPKVSQPQSPSPKGGQQKGSRKKSVFVVEKEKLRQEVEFLRALAPCKNVVDLFYVEEAGPSLHALYLEQLISIDVTSDPVVSVPLGVAFLMDGCAGLAELCRYGIIHRDISPVNILYSPVDHCWKLIDFNLAVSADNYGEYPVSDQGPVGTEGFIAPELSNAGSTYSWRTDIYGLGMSFHALFGEDSPLMVWCEMLSDDIEGEELAQVLDELIGAVDSMMTCEESRRASPKEVQDVAKGFYANVHSLMHDHPRYPFSDHDIVVELEMEHN